MGRARRFDERLLLDCAQEAFWTHGYERTSIEMVSRASGVGNGSIYAAYGSKLGLFLAVFERYCAGRVALVDGAVAARVASFEEAVARYLEVIVADCTSRADRRGCLMLNSIVELGERYPDVVAVAERTISSMEDAWAERIRRAGVDGELRIDPDEVEPLAAHIVLVSQGLIQLSRAGSSEDKLRRIAETAGRLSVAGHAA